MSDTRLEPSRCDRPDPYERPGPYSAPALRSLMPTPAWSAGLVVSLMAGVALWRSAHPQP